MAGVVVTGECVSDWYTLILGRIDMSRLEETTYQASLIDWTKTNNAKLYSYI